jgi:hypothetical protein
MFSSLEKAPPARKTKINDTSGCFSLQQNYETSIYSTVRHSDIYACAEFAQIALRINDLATHRNPLTFYSNCIICYIILTRSSLNSLLYSFWYPDKYHSFDKFVPGQFNIQTRSTCANHRDMIFKYKI